ncbi:AcrR family transcriptional regulator [Nonomuraea thailandensis]|uniref:AcrR family transcriptional regulator n=1 Tax=Nonomuraea thailandensis TaxID=1188745 RepID=A0A9X2GTM3_9ACTN|nr:TetR family transcriptional regulator [Nonomuraea thailandensis]MCP2360208.1 AcrR family transcriptional regulator [Nonomuraea thailandensis]
MAGLRERARRAVQAELATVALELFTERGFDEVTVDDIARAAGVSKRSFFRYFPAKEDAVFGGVQVMGDDIAEQLAARPADERPWDSLHAVLREWVARIDAESRATLRLIERTPSLRARFQHKREEARSRIAEALAARTGLDPFTADLLTAAAGAAVDCASREWLRTGSDGDRMLLVDTAFTRLRPSCADA